MPIKTTTGAALLAAGLLAACAAPGTVSVQPDYDKLGLAYCPTGFVLSGDVCVAPAGSAAAVAAGSGGDVADGTVPGDTPADPGNQNRNTNQNRNNNRSGGA